MNLLPVVCVVAVLFLVVIGIRVINDSMTKTRLNDEGTRIYATIQDKETVSDRRGRFYYLFLTYEFEGTEYTQKLSVRRSRYEELPAGGQIAIICLPAYPQTIRLAEDLDW